MQLFGRMSHSALLTTSLLLCLSGPAAAQWYDNKEEPAGTGEIRNPFTFKGFQMGSGGQVLSWIAPGEEITGLGFLVRGGYLFDQLPLYLGIELPMAWAKAGDVSEFGIGAIGLGLKSRVDPDRKGLGVFTGWSFDIYIPTFMDKPMAHGAGFSNNLLPGLHLNMEAINVMGTFDLVLPGNLLFFQFEVAVAAYFPVTDIDHRSIEGGLLWGALAGIHIVKQLAFMVEIKSYTPLGGYTPLHDVEDALGLAEPSHFAISTGFRLDIPVFKPAVWVSFPLDETYRSAWPDVIIGVDLAAWL
ncbi:MAG: hypothetical protein JXR96_04560 [Deltaproteobacteria bacterium]|nr:hypothetical protein [Deltaproteobacteria bacterium]